MDSRLMLLAIATPLHPGHRACRRLYSLWEGGNRRCSVASCSVGVEAAPASGGGQNPALHELGDEAEHVAFYGAVLDRELEGERGDHVGEAALPVELVPDGLARVAEREQLVLRVADAGASTRAPSA